MQATLYSRPDPAAGATCRLVAVGDLMLSGDVSRRHPPDRGPVHLFDDVAPILRSGDIVFGNLETPLCDPPVKRTMFRAPPAFAQTLATAGFNVLSLANNHILEYGPDSLQQCARVVSDCGIAVLGAGENQAAACRPVIVNRHGLRVGFLGFGRTLQIQSAIFLIDLDRRGVVAGAAVPIMMTPDLRVVVAPDEHARRIIDRNERIAREIESGAYRSGFWRQRAELNTGHTLDWLVVHLRNRDWRELGTNLAKTRPHHLAMLARYAVGR